MNRKLASVVMAAALGCAALSVSAATYIMRAPSKGLKATPSANGIVQANGTRTWADGSLAASCNGYLQGDSAHTYGGATGDGTYEINLAGTPTNVYCDMTTDGGGWTLTARILAGSYAHDDANAVGTLTSPSQGTVAKLSDTQINALVTSEYRLIPDGLGYSVYFQADSSKPFRADTYVNANYNLSNSVSGPWTTGALNNCHYGLNAYSTTALLPKVAVYGGSASNTCTGSGPGAGPYTCRLGMGSNIGVAWCGNGNNGTMWVR